MVLSNPVPIFDFGWPILSWILKSAIRYGVEKRLNLRFVFNRMTTNKWHRSTGWACMNKKSRTGLWLKGSVRQCYLSELLLIGPLVVLVGLVMRRWRLCTAGGSDGPWYSCHVMHRGAVRRQAGSLERCLSPLVVDRAGIVFALLLFIYDLMFVYVIFLLTPLLTVAARSRVAVIVGSKYLYVWEHHSGGQVGNFVVQGTSHRLLVVAESQSLLVYMGLDHGAKVFLCLRLPHFLLQSQTRCLLPLQVLHDHLQLHAAAAGRVWLSAGERVEGRGLERKAPGGWALLRGDERRPLYDCHPE